MYNELASILEKMKAVDTGDTQTDHAHADDLLLEVLRLFKTQVGYESVLTEIEEAWDNCPKWYS